MFEGNPLIIPIYLCVIGGVIVKLKKNSPRQRRSRALNRSIMSVFSRGARALQLLPRLVLSATTSAAAQEVGLWVLTYVKMVGICIQFVLSLSFSISFSRLLSLLQLRGHGDAGIWGRRGNPTDNQ